jgi:hypothetical protein
MIDPDFWNDEKLGECKRDERLLFMGLISSADDEGRGRANPKLIKSTIFPYDEDLKSKDIENMLANLAKLRLVILYKVNEQDFYYLPNFLKYQTINRPSPSKLPPPTDESISKELTDNSLNTHGTLTPNRIEKNRKEYNAHSLNERVNDFFEKVWALYPKKRGKGQVSKTQKEKLYRIGLDELTRAINRYKQETAGKDIQYVMHGSTFFNSGYVDYLDANYKDKTEPKPNAEYLRLKEMVNGGQCAGI